MFSKSNLLFSFNFLIPYPHQGPLLWPLPSLTTTRLFSLLVWFHSFIHLLYFLDSTNHDIIQYFSLSDISLDHNTIQIYLYYFKWQNSILFWLGPIGCICLYMCIFIHTHIHTHTHHIFFIHPSIGEHLSCFHILAIVNNAALNIEQHVSFQINFFSSDICPGMKLLDRILVLLLVF